MNNTWPKAVLFDLDGTLIHSLPVIHAAVNKMLNERGFSSFTMEQVAALVGKGSRNLAERSLRHFGLTPDDAEIVAAQSRFLAHYDDTSPTLGYVFPGAFDVLRQFRSEGRRLAVCTNKQKASTSRDLEAFGLAEFFDVVAGGDDVVHRKPDPRHVEFVLSELGVSPVDAVMVGDSENDTGAAIAAGVKTIVVTFGICHVPYDELGADVLVDHYDRIPDAVRSLAP